MLENQNKWGNLNMTGLKNVLYRVSNGVTYIYGTEETYNKQENVLEILTKSIPMEKRQEISDILKEKFPKNLVAFV